MAFSPDQLAVLQTALPRHAADSPPSAPTPWMMAFSPDQLVLPLWPLLFGYLGQALLLALVSLAAPPSLLPAALLAAPPFALCLGVHSLFVHLSGSPYAPVCWALAAAFVVLHPLACYMAASKTHEIWPLWVAAFVLSAFFLFAAPRGVLGRAAVCSSVLVLLSAGFLAVPAPPRLTWGTLIGALALQSAAVTAGLRSATVAVRLSSMGHSH
jgi:hypothetical protein